MSDNEQLGLLILMLFMIAALVAVYVLPAIVAFKRRHRNRTTILVINLLLGWTSIGWVVAMVWAFVGDVEPLPQSALSPIPPHPGSTGPTAHMAAEEAQKRANKAKAGWILALLCLIVLGVFMFMFATLR